VCVSSSGIVQRLIIGPLNSHSLRPVSALSENSIKLEPICDHASICPEIASDFRRREPCADNRFLHAISDSCTRIAPEIPAQRLTDYIGHEPENATVRERDHPMVRRLGPGKRAREIRPFQW
jgi:hypothetical protein